MRVVKNTLVYMAGHMANQAVAFFVLPVLTRYLSPEDYGSVALFTAFVGFAAPVVGMSMKIHIARNFFKATRERISEINWNTLIAVTADAALLLVAVLIMAVLFPGQVQSLIGLPEVWVVAALVTGWAQSVGSQYNTLLRVQARPVAFAAFEFGSAGLNLGLSLAFVVLCAWGWQGRSLGFVLSAAAAACFALVALRRMGYAQGQVDRGLMRHLYRVCLPLVPHAFAGQITLMSSRFFLNGMVGKEAVGLYAVGFTFGSLINVPLDAFNNAWTPWVFRRLADRSQRSDREIARVTLLVSLGLLALWVGIAAGAPLLLRFATNPSYYNARGFIGWVALAFVFQGMYVLVSPVLVDEGKTDSLAVISMTVAVVSLFLNFGLIAAVGAMGAAYTLAGCSLLRLLLVLGYIQRIRPMPWIGALSSRRQ